MAVVWNLNYDDHINRIESIQKKFYSFLFKKFGYHSVIKFAPYLFKCRLLDIEPLYVRRKNSSVLFVFDVLTGKIDSSNILSLLDIRVPARVLRKNCDTFLRIKGHRTNYGSAEPISTMSTFFNEVYYLFDFGESRTSFKNSIRRIWYHESSEMAE